MSCRHLQTASFSRYTAFSDVGHVPGLGSPYMARVAVHTAPEAKVVLQALLEPVGIGLVVEAAESPLHALELQHLQGWGKEEGSSAAKLTLGALDFSPGRAGRGEGCVWAGEECKERGPGKNAKGVERFFIRFTTAAVQGGHMGEGRGTYYVRRAIVSKLWSWSTSGLEDMQQTQPALPPE
jgi:hypothetical protein